MRSRGLSITVLCWLLCSPSLAGAVCDPSGADATDVASARAAIAASCDCATATSPATYARCARNAARLALQNPGCLGFMSRCAAQSTCGRPGAVACCRTSGSGKSRGLIKRNAAACTAPRGGSACVSDAPSACDACGPGGCNAPTPVPTATPPPTPTPTPGCGNGIVDPGEDCDGATCTATFNYEQVQSSCGAPGTVHACQCKDVECGGCPFSGGTVGDLCWPGDGCFVMPGSSPCIFGSCVPNFCDTGDDCSEVGRTCDNGTCCVDGSGTNGTLCRITGIFEVPCCAPLVCPEGGLPQCCLPAGEACPFGVGCCSGSCVSGVCQ